MGIPLRGGHVMSGWHPSDGSAESDRRESKGWKAASGPGKARPTPQADRAGVDRVRIALRIALGNDDRAGARQIGCRIADRLHQGAPRCFTLGQCPCNVGGQMEEVGARWCSRAMIVWAISILAP